MGEIVVLAEFRARRDGLEARFKWPDPVELWLSWMSFWTGRR